MKTKQRTAIRRLGFGQDALMLVALMLVWCANALARDAPAQAARGFCPPHGSGEVHSLLIDVEMMPPKADSYAGVDALAARRFKAARALSGRQDENGIE